MRWWLAAVLTGLAGAMWLLVLLTTLDGWTSAASASKPKAAIEIIWPLGMLIYAFLVAMARPPSVAERE